MSNILWKSLLASPAVLGAALAISSAAIAAEAQISTETVQSDVTVVQTQSTSGKTASLAPAVQTPVQVAQAAPSDSVTVDTSTLDQVNRYSREGRSQNQIGQVTSVSQLSDVRPTDWAFQALQSLVERYGCIVGYPDRTYRGNRAMTRYEFAAGLNACMDRVNELIAAATADLVKKEDLAILQKLQEEFAAELATLRGRVDALEARTATLERQQFSTTTKLAGEVIFAVTDEFGQNVDNETVFQDRVRLTLNTSFSGKDLLVTRLAAGNATFFSSQTGGPEGFQTFNFGNTGGNSVLADWVAYYFPVGDNIQFYVPAVGGLHYDYAPTSAGLMEAFDSGNGPLSMFAQRNPIYMIGGGSGIGVNVGLGKAFKLSAGYLADNSNAGAPPTAAANNPSSRNGLFGGSYSALAQLTFAPGDRFSVGLTYVNAYRQTNGPAASLAGGNAGIFTGGGTGPVLGTLAANGKFFNPTNVNAYGISGVLKLSQNLSINAFGSLIEADSVDDGRESADIWTYGLGIALADFGKKGNLLGLMAGVEPYLANPRQYYGPGSGGLNNSLPVHVEGFYKYQINDNISITPGVIWIINPGQIENSNDTIIGTLRTTFTF